MLRAGHPDATQERIVWIMGAEDWKMGDIISGYTGMMLTVDGWRLTVDCWRREQWTVNAVNSQLEFTIPMLTDLIWVGRPCVAMRQKLGLNRKKKHGTVAKPEQKEYKN